MFSMDEPIRLLLIEDDAEDAARLRELLGAARLASYALDWASSSQEGIERLRRNEHDVCLLDAFMVAADGWDVLHDLERNGCQVPVVILAGEGGTEVALTAMRAGAMDTLDKGALTPELLERVIRYAIQRCQAELALRASEERFRTIIGGINDGLVLADLHGGTLALNPAAMRMHGFESPEQVPRHLSEYHEKFEVRKISGRPEPVALADWPIVRAIRGEVFSGEEYRVQRRDTGQQWIGSYSGTPLRDADGRVSLAIVTIRDVTASKKTEAVLRQSEEKYRLIVESATEYAIFTLDPRWRVTSWNSGAERLLKYSEAEILGQPMSLVFTEEDRRQGGPEADMCDVLATGRTQNDRWYRRKDGSRFWGVGIMVSLRDDGGETVGYLKILQDITERKRAEDALKEADRRKDEFMAMLAHELRNPLAPIRYAAQMLRLAGPTQQNLQKHREVIDRQVSHMSRLLDDLLDISRITRGKIALKREVVDLRAVAERAIEGMRPMIEGRGQHLAFQATSSPLLVDGDPTRLEQIIRNLLHNANKYTEADGCIGLSVELECGDHQGCRAVVRVSDSGVGITADILPHIFEAFVQAEQTLARTQGGLGIGLAMVQRLVQLHGGTVEVHSAGRGCGSEFVVRLPLVEPVIVETAPVRLETYGQRSPAAPCRILVVDDNEDSAASLSDLLGLWGHEVRTAYDGPHALAAARQWRPEVILLDIGLPGMDGYQVAEHLRREPFTEHAQIVALTGYGAEEDRRRAQEAGFDYHLTKPVELERLKAILEKPCAA